MAKLYKFKCSVADGLPNEAATFNTTTEQEAKYEYVKLTGCKLANVQVVNEGPVRYSSIKRNGVSNEH